MEGRLSTGIDLLDRQLGGGLPAGSIVAYCAPPGSQSELLLYELVAARQSTYLTTQRASEAVRDSLVDAGIEEERATVRDVGTREPLDEMNRLVRTIPDETNLIIDPIDVLERREPARYIGFLNDLQTHMVNTESIAVLHCLAGEAVRPNRDTTRYVADIVFDLDTTINGGDIENRLSVPKFRGGSAPAETIKLNLSDTVTVDTSRDIA